MKKIIILSIALLVSFNTKSFSQKELKASKKLTELVSIMKGFYTSEKQSKDDKDYYNIALRMTPIWKNKGHYLFVEQALFDKQDKPYRVRIYKITQRGDEFVSEIYTIKSQNEWIGKWATPEVYEKLTEADIDWKEGCGVVLKRDSKNKFTGATGDKTCPSEMSGASWANSIVTVLENQIISWDQGFDKDGKQVWGAEKGGYLFIKI